MSSNTIGVLLLKDDPKSLKVVQQMLQFCMYRVLHVGKVMDAVRALLDAKDTINIFLTNVHRLEGVGSKFHDRIEEEFKLPILKMTPDNNLIQWKGDFTEAAAYILIDLRIEVISQIWQQEMAQGNVANQETDMVNQEMGQLEMAEGSVVNQEADINVELNKEKYLVKEEEEDEETEKVGNGEHLANDSEEGGENGEEQDNERHPRIRWTHEMHQKFLDALNLLGPDRTYPKKILEIMNIPGLTRAHVASHLQKHRINLKRAEENENPRPAAMNLGYNVSESSSFFTYLPWSGLHGYSGTSSLLSGSPFQSVATPTHLLEEKFMGSQYPGLGAPLLPMHPNNHGDVLRGLTLPGIYNSSNNFRGGHTLASDGESLELESSIPANYENKFNQVLQDDLLQNQYPSNPILFQQQHLTDMGSILQPQTSSQLSEHGSSVFVDPIPAIQHLRTQESSRLDDLDFGFLLNEMARPYHT